MKRSYGCEVGYLGGKDYSTMDVARDVIPRLKRELDTMNRAEKAHLLARVTAVSSNLTNDVGVIEHKVIQTDHDIEALEEILDEMKIRKENVLADDYMAFNIVDSLGDCMLHIGGAVAKLESKVAALRMALEAVNEATSEINSFANRVPGIPINE